MFSKFIWAPIALRKQLRNIKLKEHFEFWAWASHWDYDLKYNLVRYKVLKDLSFPGCMICKYCVRINVKSWDQHELAVLHCQMVWFYPTSNYNELPVNRLLKHIDHNTFISYNLYCYCRFKGKIMHCHNKLAKLQNYTLFWMSHTVDPDAH